MTVKHPPLLTPDRIQFKKKIESKKCVFDILTNLLAKGQSEVTKNQIFDALIAREKLGDTGIGNGITIPRAHLKITNPRAALLIIDKGLDIHTIDKKPLKFFFAVLIPEKNTQDYAPIFTRLNKSIASKKTIQILSSTKTPELLADHIETLISKAE